MTTVPGHNIVLQQSGAAQEMAQQAQTPKPSPEQAAAQQEINELAKNSTVQEFEEAERLKEKQEKEQERRRRLLAKKKNEKKKKEETEQDPDAPGRLLDTMA
ncbi:MAG: hypothetical protein GY729_01550 [Desulfobacteraceae bacterium]|nr:hypothetical protein [Desulfobacteraceae bacterium]